MKPDANDPKKIETLTRLAKICKKGENYKTSAKMFLQAGLKMKAMKVIIKSGDIEQIKQFATICRQPDIFILAANYLQN